MKIFKFKTNSIFNFIKKKFLIKYITIISENLKNVTKLGNIKKKTSDFFSRFYLKKFKINHFI